MIFHHLGTNWRDLQCEEYRCTYFALPGNFGAIDITGGFSDCCAGLGVPLYRGSPTLRYPYMEKPLVEGYPSMGVPYIGVSLCRGRRGIFI